MKRYGILDCPYLGCCNLYDHHHPPGDRPFDGRCWDEPETHGALMEWATAEFDGWALCTSAPSLQTLLPMAPSGARVGVWVKPFAAYKPNVNPGYCWEPVIFHGWRKGRSRDEATVRDFVSANITLRRGFTGAKPHDFTVWVLDFLGAVQGDEVVDVFPGSGAVGEAIEAFFGRVPIAEDSLCGVTL